MRKLSLLDQILTEIDQSLRVVHATAPTTERPNPAEGVAGNGSAQRDRPRSYHQADAH